MSILGLIGLIIIAIVVILGFIFGLNVVASVFKLYVACLGITIFLTFAIVNSPIKQFIGETLFMNENSEIVQKYEPLSDVYKKDFESEEAAKKYMVEFCDVSFVSVIDMGKYSDDASLQLIAVTESKGLWISLISFVIMFGLQMGVFQLLLAMIQYEGSLLDRVSGALFGVSASFVVLFVIILFVGMIVAIIPPFKEFVINDLGSENLFSWIVRPYFEMYI